MNISKSMSIIFENVLKMIDILYINLFYKNFEDFVSSSAMPSKKSLSEVIINLHTTLVVFIILPFKLFFFEGF